MIPRSIPPHSGRNPAGFIPGQVFGFAASFSNAKIGQMNNDSGNSPAYQCSFVPSSLDRCGLFAAPVLFISQMIHSG